MSTRKLRVMTLFGTRPEVIKLAPVIGALKSRRDRFESVTCFTAQHRDICDPFLRLFRIEPDHDLDVMTKDQSLKEVAVRTMDRLDEILASEHPEIVLVQGDTTSACASALAAFYRRIPVGHVEAGLRTRDPLNPYPEEMNRQIIGRIASLHFAPTRRAEAALLAEGIPSRSVFVTGNTVIDALLLAQRLMAQAKGAPALPVEPSSRRLILVTAHRRESFGAGIREICEAILALVERNGDTEVLFPVHPNPAVRGPVEKMLGAHPRIRLTDPLGYEELIAAMKRSTLILTDSGGIQEEAPTFGKPIVVMRDVTERPEIVEAGAAVLTGAHRDRIVETAERILADPSLYERMARVRNPYGDGAAAGRIARIIDAWFGPSPPDIDALKRETEFAPPAPAR